MKEGNQNLFSEFEEALKRAGVKINRSGSIKLHFDSSGNLKKIEERFSYHLTDLGK